jgi:hypothetical protein
MKMHVFEARFQDRGGNVLVFMDSYLPRPFLFVQAY